MLNLDPWTHIAWPVASASPWAEAADVLRAHAAARAAEHAQAVWHGLPVDAFNELRDAYANWLADAWVGRVDRGPLGPRRAALAAAALAATDPQTAAASLRTLAAAHRASAWGSIWVPPPDTALAQSEPGRRWPAIARGLDAFAEAEQAVLDRVGDALRASADARARRLHQIGQVAGTIGHELRNPLAVIESSAYLLDRQTDNAPALRAHVEKIRRHARACRQIIDDLLHLARDAPLRSARTNLRRAVDQAIADSMLPPTVRFDVVVPEATELYADAGLLNRALVNLLRNAGAAMGSQGVVRVAAEADGLTTRVVVDDTGPGFPADLLATAFEPLVTQRKDGVGLGLALVASVMRHHRGRAQAENIGEQGGARVTLSFPCSPAATTSSG